MKIRDAADSYIGYKQSLGMDFRTAAKNMRSFCKAAGDVELEDLESEFVLRFLRGGSGKSQRWFHNKLSVLRGFYRFCIARGYVSTSPLPTATPKALRNFTPYIYSENEICNLMANAPLVCKHLQCVIQGETLQTILYLVWGAGLRISEALRLKLCEVDLARDLFTVRDTKFFKDRLVPMDTRLTSKLATYLCFRKLHLPLLDGEDSPVFVDRRGKEISRTLVEKYFKQLRELVGIKREDGFCQPRIHDLRHTAVVSRILVWYQQGANVQVLLPHVTTYLGHVKLTDTQHYLTVTAEILREACSKFEQYALGENND
ncbi:MAG: site-specific integrase [Candidatus Obscuribacterales bacterium]|nr:site-specific integrase [Candidatus Obscuribacterales bacterium]